MSNSAPTHRRTVGISPLKLYMETDASERSETNPSRLTRWNSPPYPLHTIQGGHHGQTTSHTGEKSRSCPEVNPILPSSNPRPIQLFIIIPNQENVKCLYSKPLQWAQPTLRSQLSLTYSKNSSPCTVPECSLPYSRYSPIVSQMNPVYIITPSFFKV